MKYKLLSIIYLHFFAISESLVVEGPTRISFYGRNSHKPSLLSAIPSPSSFRSSGGSVPSKTACDSAVNVEWEPMSELERRIEDGVNYEHFPAAFHQNQNQPHHRRERMPGCHSKAKRISETEDDNIPGVRAVFCGYRYTPEDYNRLKAADVT